MRLKLTIIALISCALLGFAALYIYKQSNSLSGHNLGSLQVARALEEKASSASNVRHATECYPRQNKTEVCAQKTFTLTRKSCDSVREQLNAKLDGDQLYCDKNSRSSFVDESGSYTVNAVVDGGNVRVTVLQVDR